ncbi:hypothetical protein SO802_022166 [Lithocarpus litseifolius]|uniref:Uncharacterized protein n=1 Tax=Lithocarpus litseifolius TaxID=425828 RepID=A0AAW2CKA5_9ROSI
MESACADDQKRFSVTDFLEYILKEFNVHAVEMRYSVSKILPSFPIMFIIYASCTLGTVFMLLPHEQVDGSPVPILVFKDQPKAFHAFLISIMFSFTGAFSALLIQRRPRVERFCRVYAMASMILAIAILLYAIAHWDCSFTLLLQIVKVQTEDYVM